MSINQMVESVAASERGKRAIVCKQKHSSTFRVAILAIRGFMQSHFPERFCRIKCSFFTPREKQIRFGELTFVAAPDLNFRFNRIYYIQMRLRVPEKRVKRLIIQSLTLFYLNLFPMRLWTLVLMMSKKSNESVKLITFDR